MLSLCLSPFSPSTLDSPQSSSNPSLPALDRRQTDEDRRATPCFFTERRTFHLATVADKKLADLITGDTTDSAVIEVFPTILQWGGCRATTFKNVCRVWYEKGEGKKNRTLSWSFVSPRGRERAGRNCIADSVSVYETWKLVDLFLCSVRNTTIPFLAFCVKCKLHDYNFRYIIYNSIIRGDKYW